ncbi:MAG: serine hydrolase [Candidatus Pacearchaeota archaeon]|jgi:beta-lactamase class A
MKELKIFAFIELIIIISLLVLLYFSYTNNFKKTEEFSLLSTRISSGVLPAKSMLIFNFESLKKDIQNYITANNLNTSVYILNLRDGVSVGINEDTSYKAFSLNKLPVAIAILKKVEDGNLLLNSQLTILPEDRDPTSGNLYLINATNISVKESLRYMLSESDNTALDVLMHQISLKDLQYLSAYLDYYNKDINYTKKLADNVFEISPRSTGNIFLSLYLSTILKPENSQLILGDLANNSFDIHNFSGISKDVIISHKYGEYFVNKRKFFHDCGIMYIDDSRIFYCVMTQDINKEQSHIVVGTIANKTYNFVIDSKLKNKNLTV